MQSHRIALSRRMTLEEVQETVSHAETRTMLRLPRPAFRVRPFWPLLLGCHRRAADDWPQWFGPQRDGIWREKGISTSSRNGGPKVRWRTGLGGGYAGPAVADGKVYVTDRVLANGVKDPDNPFDQKARPGKERVQCLDDKDGKVLWTAFLSRQV